MKISYSSIFKESFKKAKKISWLWVFAIAAATFSGSFDTNFSNQISGQDTSSFMNNLPDTYSTVLNSFLYWLNHLNPSSIAAFAGGIGLVTIVGAIIGWVAGFWAQAGLIKGSEETLNEDKVELNILSKEAFTFLKGLIVFSVLLSLSFIGITIAIFLVFLILSLIGVAVKVTAVSIVLAIVGIILFIYLAIVFGLTSIFGQRLIVLKNYTSTNALKTGLKMAKKYFWSGVKLSIINSLFSTLLGLIAFMIIGIILGIPAFILATPFINMFSSGQIQAVNPFNIAGILSLILVFTWTNKLVGVFLIVYKNLSWNLLFREVVKEK